MNNESHFLWKRMVPVGAIALLLIMMMLVLPSAFASSGAGRTTPPYKNFNFIVHSSAESCTDDNTAVAHLTGTLYEVEDGNEVKLGQMVATVQQQRGRDNEIGGDIILVDIVGSSASADGVGIKFNIVDGVPVTPNDDNKLGGGDIILVDIVGSAASADDDGQIGGGEIILVDIVGASITGPAVFTTDPCAETAVSQSERTVFYQYPWQVSLSG